MTLTLDVTPELQRRLQEEATRQGIAAEEYARLLLENQLLHSPRSMEPGKAAPEERKRKLREWIESNRGLPSLPDAAFRRSSFYGERG